MLNQLMSHITNKKKTNKQTEMLNQPQQNMT